MLHVSFIISLPTYSHFFYIVVCLIGCSSLQHSMTPWKYVNKAIEIFNNEERRFCFIKDLEALYQKHKYGSEEFCSKVADLIVGNASTI